MPLNPGAIAAIALLCISPRVAAAPDATTYSSQPPVQSGLELRDGRLFSSKHHKNLPGAGETVIQFTVSPNGQFLVFVRNEESAVNSLLYSGVSMWIVNLRSGKRIQVAKYLSVDPAIGCCMLVEIIDNKGYGDRLSLVNGAFWTRKNEVLVNTPARTGGGMEFFLSMDGKLKGDV